MANRILMVTPEDEDVEVEEADFESAKSSGLEPAFEMVDRDGNVNVVRKRHMADAEKAGMTAKPVWDALNTRTPDRNKVGAGEAFARGFANMASPVADEAAGAFRNPKGAAKAALGLFGVNMGDDRDVQEYQAVRNAYRERDDDAWDQQKFAYGAGGATGIGAGIGAGMFGGGAAVTGLGKATANAATKATARLSPRAAKAATSAASAAFEGGLQAAGGGTDAQGQADLATGDVGGVAKQAGIGAATGGLFGGLSEEAIRLLQKSIPALKTMAERAAYRTTGGMKSDINKIYGNTPEDVGRALLDDGLITPFTKRSGEQLESKIRGRLGEFRGKQDEFFNVLDELGDGVPFEDIERRLVEEINLYRSKAKPGVSNRSYADALERELVDLRKTFGGAVDQAPMVDMTPKMSPVGGFPDQAALPGPSELATTRAKVHTPRTPGEPPIPGPEAVPVAPKLGFREALKAKRGFDQGGRYQNRTDAPSVEAARATRKAIKDAIDDAISASPAGPASKDAYKADRHQSKLFLDALAGLDQENARQTARKQVFGLTDTITGTGAAGTALAAGASAPATAAITLGTLAAKKGLETYGDAMSARLFDGAAKIIQKQGFEEGMRTLTRLLGADAAAQLGIALGERQRMQGGKP